MENASERTQRSWRQGAGHPPLYRPWNLANEKSVIAFQRTAEDMRLEQIDSGNPDHQASPGGDWHDIADLAANLRRAPPWLLFLQTCKSASGDTKVEGSRSAAQQIADVDVPFVIAMQYKSITTTQRASPRPSMSSSVPAIRSIGRSGPGVSGSETVHPPGRTGGSPRPSSICVATTRR